jgi:TetR/AcrR family transcriptional regulator, cholesterol catabolism regulator
METKERILKATLELFLRFGIKSVTMDDIARHMSISKKTIYQFFNDKDEIVHMLMQTQLQQDMSDFAKIAETSVNVVEEVFNHMKKMADIFRNINPNIFYDLRKYHPKTWEMFHEFRNHFVYNQVVEALEKGKTQGLVRTDISTDVVSKLRIEEIDMGFNPVLFPPEKYRILDVQLAMTEHFLYGICTLKGHKLINKYKQIIEED